MSLRRLEPRQGLAPAERSPSYMLTFAAPQRGMLARSVWTDALIPKHVSAIKLMLFCAVTAIHPLARGQSSDVFEDARSRMVDSEIVAAGVTNERVVHAMRITPRHEFVPDRQQRYAYYDMAMPIGFGQTISPPYVVAYMTAKLDPRPTDRVLEIGTGSGYQAAVLSPLVDQVFSIEIVPGLGRRAGRTLRRLGYKNIETKIGDGFKGWPQHAPFDKIIVTCSPENVPKPLVEQLAEGGRMIIPLGRRYQQSLYLFRKVSGELKQETLESTFFVPMTGQAEKQREVIPDPSRPQLAHGGFEQHSSSPEVPAGWFYLRQGKLETDPDAPDGTRCLTFTNETPGRSAHAMQAFGVDGRKVNRLTVSMWIRGDGITEGQDHTESAKAIVEFYGDHRAPVGRDSLGPWIGTFGWQQIEEGVNVPTKARLAVIGIGLFGATGKVSFDQVDVDPARKPLR